MAAKADITPEMLRQLLRYEPETGMLYWKPRPLNMFPNERMGRIWNTRFAGKEAGAMMTTGYSLIRLWMKPFLAHRIIWMLEYGAWPTGEIDHIDGVRNNNALVNLRDVSHHENTKNLRPRSGTTSGVNGVRFDEKSKRWNSYICLDGKSKFLGSFPNLEEAADVRAKANKKYGFHENHGKLI